MRGRLKSDLVHPPPPCQRLRLQPRIQQLLPPRRRPRRVSAGSDTDPGADHVIDYTQEDFTKGAQRYDLIVDTVGNHPLLEYRRVLNPKGIFVLVGAPKRS